MRGVVSFGRLSRALGAATLAGLLVVAGACGSTVDVPTEVDRCVAGGGQWSEGIDCMGSGEWCGRLRGEGAACELSFAPGCGCGPGRCWEAAWGVCRDEGEIRGAPCEAKGGRWEESVACDGYGGYCAAEGCDSEERAPGCVCAAGFCLFEGECIADDSKEALCVRTGGTWRELGALGAPFVCGVVATQDAVGFGCDCGSDACHVDGECMLRSTYDEGRCLESGGSWTSLACGGAEDSCVARCEEGLDAVASGCDCGPGRCFDGECEDGTTMAERCVESGGAWEEIACGGLDETCPPTVGPDECGDIGDAMGCRCPEGACWNPLGSGCG